MINSIKLSGFRNRDQAEIPLGAGNGLKAFITLKAAGDMNFRKRNILPDRKKYFQRQKLDPGKIYSVYQEHTKLVVPVNTRIHPEEYAEIRADGLVAPRENIQLTVTVADCLPIFLYDKQNGAFGLVHSGWKGTGIVLEAIAVMTREMHCEKQNIKIVIGPGIGACCYDVPFERYRDFSALYGTDCVQERQGRYFLDLKKANTLIVESCGISDITVVDHCTVCCPDFHSYRREGADFFQLMLAYTGYGGCY